MSWLQPVALPLLRNCCHPCLVKVVDTLTLEFESVVNVGKIREEDYKIVPSEPHDSTQACHLRSGKKDTIYSLEKLTANYLQQFYTCSSPLGVLFDF
ncbi:hypothetical protein AVEN_179273-1 [Araneus ventricosus]|uniref:Uncharacterized protein n=1 Tax=Araneus ventricosus TaxID=182803 RepID=A0A4Y2D0S3_ARAVE|nr:hypothetical protein AVEN_240084-1 [Araneus ventricosus]GBM09083.1 hypothetical protein AVEN_266319-1 [Araneus ventricosus]GBM09135.1 hypothetical protein AVEN_53743-1 [Araneus ventricosus]GBM09235.1 hypothetical protein AVEN_179273-1 [Araneus ventricosus]